LKIIILRSMRRLLLGQAKTATAHTAMTQSNGTSSRFCSADGAAVRASDARTAVRRTKYERLCESGDAAICFRLCTATQPPTTAASSASPPKPRCRACSRPSATTSPAQRAHSASRRSTSRGVGRLTRWRLTGITRMDFLCLRSCEPPKPVYNSHQQPPRPAQHHHLRPPKPLLHRQQQRSEGETAARKRRRAARTRRMARKRQTQLPPRRQARRPQPRLRCRVERTGQVIQVSAALC